MLVKSRRGPKYWYLSFANEQVARVQIPCPSLKVETSKERMIEFLICLKPGVEPGSSKQESTCFVVAHTAAETLFLPEVQIQGVDGRNRNQSCFFQLR